MTTSEPVGPSFPAQPPRRTSRVGLELIKSFEGFRPRAARLPGERYVVGYGHISSTREGVRISEADAHALLVYDLLQIEAAVNEWALAPLTQNQFDALVSFALSVGLKNFRRSNVLRHLNQGSMLQAAGALEMWRQAELDGEAVVIDALVRRRAAEKALFLTPPEGHVPASSAVLRPLMDYSAHASIPRRPPEEVSVPLEGETATVTRGPFAADSETLAETAEPESDLGFAAAEDSDAAASTDSMFEATDGDSEPPMDAASDDEAEALADFGSQSPVEDGSALLPTPEVSATPEAETSSSADAEMSSLPETEDLAPTPDEGEEDDEWSAARAAAAAVTARLHELLPRDGFVDEDEDPAPEVLTLHPSPPEEDMDDAAMAAGGDTLPEIEPFPLADLVDREPEAEPVSTPPSFSAGAEAGPEAPDANRGAEELPPLDLAAFEPLPSPPEPQATGPYLLLGLVGLLFIIAALVSLFRSPAPGDISSGVSTISWVLGLIGIAGVAGALWMTLGREEISSDDPPQA